MEMKCFETGEHFGTAQGSFPNHMKHFEEIEKKLYFLDFDGFYAVKGKNGMDLSPIGKYT